jgi:transcriptional regulator with XRE-family HTH domain
MTIGENIADLRKKKGWTQAEFGEMLGVSNQAVSKWESGMSMPDIMLLPHIAEVFECSIDELFDYLPKKERADLHILPGDFDCGGMERYLSRQIKSQLDQSGSTNKFLEIMAENLSGEFELTDENIERLLDAYRELYKGARKKK